VSRSQSIHSADCDPQSFIPNVFSPNGDKVNDVWEVHIDPAMDVIRVECSVFDRWGNTIFTSTSGPIQWDGTYKGEVMMSGVYVYVVRLVADNDIRTLSGSVTIVR
jgi:gliding motility-associated-like protein